MFWMIAVISLALNGVPSSASDPVQPSHPGISVTAVEGAPPEESSVLKSARLSQPLAPEEHVCDMVAVIQPWHDASDPVPFATGPTARLDAQELWAATSMAPLMGARYADGLPGLVVLGIPVVLPESRIVFSAAGWRLKWPLC